MLSLMDYCYLPFKQAYMSYRCYLIPNSTFPHFYLLKTFLDFFFVLFFRWYELTFVPNYLSEPFVFNVSVNTLKELAALWKMSQST